VIEPEHKKPVFLLGGADLEMDAIRSLLVAEKAEYIDHGLSWETASLSSYEDVLNQYSPEEYDIYGIELNNDLAFTPYNYHEIDHHGKKDYLPSSLEQVAALLSHELTLEESLIAANDKWHIRGMKALLANAKEAERMSETEKERMIQEIRIRDRKSQGVTPEEEIAAEEEIAQGKFFVRDNLVVFQTGLNHFSPIVDRLSRYDRIVVFNENKLVIYGLGCHIAGAEVAYDFRLNDEQTYSGGGPLGYWGIKEGVLSAKTIAEIAETIKTINMEYSGHIFYFPFSWEGDLRPLRNKENTHWKKSTPDSEEMKSLYDEKNYFYPYVHKVLYDDGEEKSMILHLEMPCGPEARYEITVNNGGNPIRYSLRLDALNLNLYSTGVGLLSFHLTNDTNLCYAEDGTPRIMDHEDILKINQYGRRVNLPFYADKVLRKETAQKISIVGLEGFDVLSEDFNGYDVANDFWKSASFIGKLLNDLDPDFEYSPVVDDRMFVMSWYKNSSLINEVLEDTDSWNHDANNHFWYRFLYVDSTDPTCQDAQMRTELLNQSTYKRWIGYESLYGVTRYSMVYLTYDSVPDYLINTFRTIYARMAELVLIQRSSALKFSGRVTTVSEDLSAKNINDQVRELYKDYIVFINNFYHKEVTSQDQGIELYEMMQRSLSLEQFVKDLDDDIGELYQYTSMVDNDRKDEKANHLNWVMSIFAPASFVAGIWGMNAMCDVYRSGTFWGQIAWIVGVTATIVFICWIIHRKSN
jgi:hypothetical protein